MQLKIILNTYNSLCYAINMQKMFAVSHVKVDNHSSTVRRWSIVIMSHTLGGIRQFGKDLL